MIVGYGRVSSTDQSLDVQVKMLEAAGCEKIFSEQRSGSKLSGRGELEKCINYVRDGDTLIVTRIDRFARSVADFHNLIQQLDVKNVEFRCLLQPFDTTTPQGRLLRDILAAFAEFETSVRRERQREGIEEARAKGVYARPQKKRTTQKYAHASRMLRLGRSYDYVEGVTGIPNRTLRNRFPGYNERGYTPRGSGPSDETGDGNQENLIPDNPSGPTSPSAAGAVESEATPETNPKKAGLFGRFRST